MSKIEVMSRSTVNVTLRNDDHDILLVATRHTGEHGTQWSLSIRKSLMTTEELQVLINELQAIDAIEEATPSES